jgi:hypothetical protein
VDDLTLATLHADRERLAKALHDYAQAQRSIQPSETDIAALRARLEILDRLIARHARKAQGARSFG